MGFCERGEAGLIVRPHAKIQSQVSLLGYFFKEENISTPEVMVFVTLANALVDSAHLNIVLLLLFSP